VVIRIRDPDRDSDTDPDPDPYRDTGKTCLIGLGMHYAVSQCFYLKFLHVPSINLESFSEKNRHKNEEIH